MYKKSKRVFRGQKSFNKFQWKTCYIKKIVDIIYIQYLFSCVSKQPKISGREFYYSLLCNASSHIQWPQGKHFLIFVSISPPSQTAIHALEYIWMHCTMIKKFRSDYIKHCMCAWEIKVAGIKNSYVGEKYLYTF